MKTNSLIALPPVSAESNLTAYSKQRKTRVSVVKHMPPPTPPDEDTIHHLNRLASTQPFCSPYKCRKHELL